MKTITRLLRRSLPLLGAAALQLAAHSAAEAQTPAFPGAGGFGRFASGARGASSRQVYVVTNLNDAGPGSFRDAVSQPGRIVTFAVGGIVRLQTNVQVAPNVTIAGQTAPGDGIVFFNKRVTFTGASNSIARFLRIRLGATDNQGNDASGLANGSNIILDHMSFSWGMDEVFSINWDGKGTAPDNITIQNSIIGQGLHRVNHSAGGLIQTPDGGKVSLLQNLYISNKTRNPKVKGVNEFVNNVVYDWGNGNRLGNQLNYGWSGDAYIMGGSAGVSEVNIINNYFVGGPLTPPDKTTPFSRGTGTFFLYGAGNYFDNNRNGLLDGAAVPYDTVGYPGIVGNGFRAQPFAYPAAAPVMTAAQAYQHVIDSAGACYPRRDQVDGLMIDEVRSRGTQGYYVYNESDLPFSNGGLGEVFGAPTPADSDQDGMPDQWEASHGLNPNNPADAVAFSGQQPQYLNVEVYVNSLIKSPAPAFVKPPTAVQLLATSTELPAPGSEVTVSWTDNSATETHFVLERSADGVTYAVVAQPAADATSYSDAGLTPNTTYYYRLKAVTPTTESAYSVVAGVRTPALPSAPGVPATPTPTDGQPYADLTAGGLQLKWTGSSNTQTYAVYFGSSPTALTKRADVAYAAAPGYTLSGLADNTTYYWRIDASNAKGTTDGPVWSFRTTGTVTPELVGHWAFDETQADGLQILDQSSYQNHGVLGLDDDQSIRVPGKVSGALNFASADPSRYVVRIPHQDQLYLDRSSFSLAFWMKADASTLPQTNNESAYLLCKGSITRNAATGATGRRFDIEFKNRQLRFAIDDDVNKDELQADATGFYSGQWVHVVAIRDVPGKKLLLYQNGALVKEIATKAGGIGETSALIIGNIGELEFASAANAPAPYTGQLDELKVFNYVLTAQDIIRLRHAGPLPLQAYNPNLAPTTLLEGYDAVPLSWQGGYQTDLYKLYLGTAANALSYVADVALADAAYSLPTLAPNATYYWRVDAVNGLGTTAGETWSFRTGNPKGLVAHYRLDETSGLLAADSSPFHQDGTLRGLGTSQWNPAGGKFGGSLLLGPSSAPNGAVAVPSAPQLLFDQNAFTISLWTKIPANTYTFSTGKDTYLLHKGTFEAGTGKWYGLQLRDGVLTFSIDDGATKTDAAFRVTTAPNNLFNDQWQHVVAIRDVATKTLKLYLNGTLVATKAYTTGTIGKADALLIGNSAENKPFRDQLDDVRLFNYALSDDEILDLSKREQTITFAALPAALLGDADLPLNAAASSGLPVSFSSSDESVAKVVGTTVQLVGAGTAVITATQPGDATFLAAAPVARPLTVAPLLVRMLHQDGDNARPINNVIKPSLQLRNDGPAPVSYAELTARYWLTAENDAGLNGWIDYAQLGAGRVQLRYVRLPEPRQGAYAYVEYRFDAAAGSLAAGASSGVIQSRLANADWADLNEADDYSYRPAAAYALNEHLTLYRNGRLVWGTEPAAAAPLAAVQVLSSNRNSRPSSNSLSTYLAVQNTGNQPLSYADLKVRYWFTAEGSAGLNYWVDYAKLGASSVTGSFTRLSPALPGADAYLELGFAATAGTLYPLSSSGNVQYRVAKADWSSFEEANDHSYRPTGPLAANEHVTVYYQGQLIYGQEPAATAARGAASAAPATGPQPTTGFQVYPTTVADGQLRFVGAGAGGQVELLTLVGRRLGQPRRTEAATGSLSVAGLAAGTYLVRFTAPDGSGTTSRIVVP